MFIANVLLCIIGVFLLIFSIFELFAVPRGFPFDQPLEKGQNNLNSNEVVDLNNNEVTDLNNNESMELGLPYKQFLEEVNGSPSKSSGYVLYSRNGHKSGYAFSSKIENGKHLFDYVEITEGEVINK